MSVSSVKAIINGQEYALTYNSTSGRYEAVITAPQKSSYTASGHYYPVSVTAEDDAGNEATVNASSEIYGNYLKLVVKEKNAPVQVVTYPTSDAFITNNRPVIRWYVYDDDSGVDPSTIGIRIDGGSVVTGSAINKETASDGYLCAYSPAALDDGNHTIVVIAEDYDGNESVSSPTLFTVDTVAPLLNVSYPTDNLATNETVITVTGTTNDATSSPVTVTVKVNSGEFEEATVDSEGTFNKDVTLSEGANIIIVKAVDGVGHETIVTRSVTLDTDAPVFGNITIIPNPVDAGTTFVISIEVTDE